MVPVYDQHGNRQAAHVATGTHVLDNVNIVTLEGPAAFADKDSFIVLIDEQVMSSVSRLDGSRFKIHGGRAGKLVRWVAIGT